MLTLSWKQEANCGILCCSSADFVDLGQKHQTSSFDPVIIIKAAKGFCDVSVNTCCFGALAENNLCCRCSWEDSPRKKKHMLLCNLFTFG